MNDILVLGGGLAGGAAAALLAGAGRSVTVLERETGPNDRICGEFLSIEAQRDLLAIGIDPRTLGAVATSRVRLLGNGRRIEAALPFVGLGVCRRLLDEAMLELAARRGARIERGVRVREVAATQVRTDAGMKTAAHIMLATGKRDVRGAGPDRRPSEDRDHVGFKLHWKPPLRQWTELAGTIEIILFEGGYAGIQPLSGGVLNLCLLIHRQRLAELGGGWNGVLAMLMRHDGFACRLGDAEPLHQRPLAIANLPYGRLCTDPGLSPANLFRLGDQAAMTASLTGDGMAIALRSARIAARCLEAGGDAVSYHRLLHAVVSRQVRRAMWLQRVTEWPLARNAGLGLLSLAPTLLSALAGATRLPAWRDRDAGDG